jgi:hypothetical protein
MGFFTQSSKFIVKLFSSIFALIGLLVLGMGLWMRFHRDEWIYMQSQPKGEVAVFTYIGLGAAMFVLSLLGIRGASKAHRRFSLFLFQLGTLACLIASVYGSAVLFGTIKGTDSACISGNCETADNVNARLAGHIGEQELVAIHQYQRPFAIFLACIAGAEGLMLLASFILCFQKPQEYLPTFIVHRHAAAGAGVEVQHPTQPGCAWVCRSCQKHNTSPDRICIACFTQN